MPLEKLPAFNSSIFLSKELVSNVFIAFTKEFADNSKT